MALLLSPPVHTHNNFFDLAVSAQVNAAVDHAHNLLLEGPLPRVEQAALAPLLRLVLAKGFQLLVVAEPHRLDALTNQLRQSASELSPRLTVVRLPPASTRGSLDNSGWPSASVLIGSWEALAVDSHREEPALSAGPPAVVLVLDAHLAPERLRTAFGESLTLLDLVALHPGGKGFRAFAEELISSWHSLGKRMQRTPGAILPPDDTLFMSLVPLERALEQVHSFSAQSAPNRRVPHPLLTLINMRMSEYVAWGEFSPTGVLRRIHSMPLELDPLRMSGLWSQYSSVIFVSDRLSIAGTTLLIQQELSLSDVKQCLMHHSMSNMELYLEQPAHEHELPARLLRKLNETPQLALIVVCPTRVEQQRWTHELLNHSLQHRIRITLLDQLHEECLEPDVHHALYLTRLPELSESPHAIASLERNVPFSGLSTLLAPVNTLKSAMLDAQILKVKHIFVNTSHSNSLVIKSLIPELRHLRIQTRPLARVSHPRREGTIRASGPPAQAVTTRLWRPMKNDDLDN